MGAGAPDIAQVVPELHERLPGLANPAALDTEQARFRFFDRVSGFLRNASNHQARVLVLEDLHLADAPSLLLLQFLARVIHQSRLMIVLTYRDVDLGRRHTFTEPTGELVREHTGHVMVVGDSRHLTSPASSRLPQGFPPQSVAAAIYEKSAGNPL